MKHKTVQRTERVKQEIQAGTPYPEMVKKLSAEFGVSPRSMDYIITLANQQLAEEHRQQQETKTAACAEMLKEEAEEMALTMKEVSLYLSKVIRGQWKEQRAMSTKDGIEVVDLNVRTHDMLKAINLFCRYAEMLGINTKPNEPEKITGFYIISQEDHDKKMAAQRNGGPGADNAAILSGEGDAVILNLKACPELAEGKDDALVGADNAGMGHIDPESSGEMCAGAETENKPGTEVPPSPPSPVHAITRNPNQEEPPKKETRPKEEKNRDIERYREYRAMIPVVR